MSKTNQVWEMVAGAALLTLTGCSCCTPVGERTTVTTVQTRPMLPPVGEAIVVRDNFQRARMTFVPVRPPDRRYDAEDSNWDRPWPWGPLNAGNFRRDF